MEESSLYSCKCLQIGLIKLLICNVFVTFSALKKEKTEEVYHLMCWKYFLASDKQFTFKPEMD